MGAIRDTWRAHCKGDYRREFGTPWRNPFPVGTPERLEALIHSNCPQRPCYVGVYAYEKWDGKPNKWSAVLNTCFFDFDCAEQPQRAFDDAIRFYKECEKRGIAVRVYFSGGKGIAAYLDFNTIEIEGWLKKPVLESFQRGLRHKLRLDTMDVQVIGDIGRISRLPNTKHQSSGLWCVPVTIDELEKGVEYVKELAKNPLRISIKINSENNLPEILEKHARRIRNFSETEKLVAKARKMLELMKARRKGNRSRYIDSEQVKANNSLAGVIGTRETLILCPFHNDHNPSLSIDHGKQLWHCFGCGKSGDVISWVMYRDGVDFIEALRRLG